MSMCIVFEFWNLERLFTVKNGIVVAEPNRKCKENSSTVLSRPDDRPTILLDMKLIYLSTVLTKRLSVH